MQHRIYRSLDRPSSLFGIRGRFMFLFMAFVVVAGLVGVVAGVAFGSVIGIVAFLVCGAVGYFLTTGIQARMTERQFVRFIGSRKLPDYVVLRPGRFMEWLQEEEFYED